MLAGIGKPNNTIDGKRLYFAVMSYKHTKLLMWREENCYSKNGMFDRA
jgi:hypothetical protein